MLDDAKQWFQFAQAHLDVFGPLVGSLAGWAVAIIAETWFIDPQMAVRRQKQVLVLLNVGASWLLSVLVWGAMDADDNFYRRAVVSIVAAVLAPIVYPTVGQIATKLWPSVGSAWAAKADVP